MRLLSLLLLLVFTTGPAWAKWSTTKFEIVEGNPDLETRGSSNYEPARSKLNRLEVRAIETYLGRVGQTLEDFGFPEPKITSRGANGAFRIFIGDADGNLGVFSDSRKFALQTVILDPNHELVSKGDKLTRHGWQTLAHEVFHAIQENCVYSKSSASRGLWLSEGTADAIGYYCAEHLAPLGTFPGAPDELGAREYFMKLVTPRRGGVNKVNRRGYRTHSFWRYLAQVDMSMRAPTKRKAPLTYGQDESFAYLARLLNTPMPSDSTDLSCLQWLDDFLKKDASFGGGLYKHFPEFLTTYADHKYLPTVTKPKIFLNAVLGPLQKTLKVGPGKVETQSVLTPPVAGNRVEVDLNSNFPVVVSAKVYAEGSQNSLPVDCKSVQIGVLGRDKQQRPGVVNQLPSGEAVATWTLALPQGTSTLLVTNTSLDVKDCKRLRIDLSFLQGSLASVSPAGKSQSVIGPDIAYRGDETILAFSHPKEVFVAAKMQAFAEETAAGLFAPRDEQGDPSAKFRALQEASANLDLSENNGEVPTIVIPGLSPGQTGVFEGATITHRHPDLGRLQTVRFDRATRRKVGDGRVTITEHTPLYMKGSYSGLLRDSSMEKQGRASGEFLIPLPLLKRDDVEQQGEHIGALNKAHFLARTRSTDGRRPGTLEAGTEDKEDRKGGPKAGSSGSKGAGAAMGVSSRDRILQRFRRLLKQAGASPKEIETQMKEVSDMSLEELRQLLEFIEKMPK